MRAAVYSGTRNLYPDMVTAAKSLLHNGGADKIFFLIEDDHFPEWLPPHIETMNVSGQAFFPKNGANFKTSFTYMSLLRVCYTKLLPDLDKVLQLDCDTIVLDSLDELWNLNMNGKWFAAVEEHHSTYKPYGPVYFNIGVAMFNLDQIRTDHADEACIRFLNTVKVPYIDQDAWNRYGVGKAIKLPVRYNETIVTGYTEDPAVVHFAGFKNWQNNVRAPRREYLKRYREMSWEEVLNGKNTDRSTDI